MVSVRIKNDKVSNTDEEIPNAGFVSHDNPSLSNHNDSVESDENGTSQQKREWPTKRVSQRGRMVTTMAITCKKSLKKSSRSR